MSDLPQDALRELAEKAAEMLPYIVGDAGAKVIGDYIAALRQRCELAERRLNEASHDAIYEAHKREQAERERDEAVGVLRHIDVLPDEPDPIARLCEARKAARRVLRKLDAALAHDAQKPT